MAMLNTRSTMAAGRVSRRASVAVRAADGPSPGPPQPPKPMGDAPPNAGMSGQVPSMAPTPVPAAAPAIKTISLGDAMAFSGPAPETVNGRLAMLGFTAALGAELVSGETVLQQFADATPAILAGAAVFAVASLIPLLKGADLNASIGPFSPAAEKLNGRAAMIGFAALIGLELARSVPLF